MTGLIALVGGREHTPGCEPIDRHLLEETVSPRPAVTIVPYASSRWTTARTSELAVTWWGRLGAEVRVAPQNAAGAMAAIDAADVIVLTGGVPDRLHRRLYGSAVWERIQQRWIDGAHVTGSSSGAMVLASSRQLMHPPFTVRPGLGLLHGIAVAPHYELPFSRKLADWRSRTHPHLTILGLGERTGVIGRSGRFVVHGAGTVIVRDRTGIRSLRSGDVLELPAHTIRNPDGRRAGSNGHGTHQAV